MQKSDLIWPNWHSFGYKGAPNKRNQVKYPTTLLLVDCLMAHRLQLCHLCQRFELDPVSFHLIFVHCSLNQSMNLSAAIQKHLSIIQKKIYTEKYLCASGYLKFSWMPWWWGSHFKQEVIISDIFFSWC